MLTSLLKKSILHAAVVACTLCSVSCGSDKDQDPEPEISNTNIKATVNQKEMAFTMGAAGIEDNVLVFSTGPSQAVNGETSSIALEVPAATGTYEKVSTGDADANTDFFLAYVDFDKNLLVSAYEGGKVRITISKLDRTAKKVSGTFSGTVLSFDGRTVTTIANGSFEDVPLLD